MAIQIIALYILIFFLGAALGSFAGVVMERGRGGFSWEMLPEMLGGRSYCVGCKKTLQPWQLIPLVGWLVQKGKCYRCQSPIPAWYMGFESSMGLLFILVAVVLTGGDLMSVIEQPVLGGQIIFWRGVVWAMWTMLVADLFRYELNVYVWLGLIGRLLARSLFGFVDFAPLFKRGFVWVCVFAVIYWGGRWYYRQKFGEDGEAIGEGDVMVALTIGFLFPFISGSGYLISGIQLVCIYLVISSLLGLLFWLGRGLLQKDMNHVIPFLPGMLAGYRVTMLLTPYLLAMLDV